MNFQNVSLRTPRALFLILDFVFLYEKRTFVSSFHGKYSALSCVRFTHTSSPKGRGKSSFAQEENSTQN